MSGLCIPVFLAGFVKDSSEDKQGASSGLPIYPVFILYRKLGFLVNLEHNYYKQLPRFCQQPWQWLEVLPTKSMR